MIVRSKISRIFRSGLVLTKGEQQLDEPLSAAAQKTLALLFRAGLVARVAAPMPLAKTEPAAVSPTVVGPSAPPAPKKKSTSKRKSATKPVH